MFEVSVPIKNNKQKIVTSMSLEMQIIPDLLSPRESFFPLPPSVTNEMPSLTLSEGHKIQVTRDRSCI